MADHTSEQERAELWHKQEESYQQLRKLENASPELVYGQDWTKKIIEKDPDFIGCVDERVKPADHAAPKIGLAGCGVLWTPEQRRVSANKIKAAGLYPAEVNWHKHCGACAAFTKLHPESEAAATGMEIAEDFARALGSSEVTVSGYDAGDVPMENPVDLHPARAVVVDATGRFNTSLLGALKTFTLSAAYYPDEQTIAGELKFIEDIAMGDHGLGDKFTADSPFLVLLAGRKNNPTWSAKSMRERLADTLRAYGDRISAIETDF